MTENESDTVRAQNADRAILDNRDPRGNGKRQPGHSGVLVRDRSRALRPQPPRRAPRRGAEVVSV